MQVPSEGVEVQIQLRPNWEVEFALQWMQNQIDFILKKKVKYLLIGVIDNHYHDQHAVSEQAQDTGNFAGVNLHLRMMGYARILNKVHHLEQLQHDGLDCRGSTDDDSLGLDSI